MRVRQCSMHYAADRSLDDPISRCFVQQFSPLIPISACSAYSAVNHS